jgi:hypothetical protein
VLTCVNGDGSYLVARVVVTVVDRCLPSVLARIWHGCSTRESAVRTVEFGLPRLEWWLDLVARVAVDTNPLGGAILRLAVVEHVPARTC